MIKIIPPADIFLSLLREHFSLFREKQKTSSVRTGIVLTGTKPDCLQTRSFNYF